MQNFKNQSDLFEKMSFNKVLTLVFLNLNRFLAAHAYLKKSVHTKVEKISKISFQKGHLTRCSH